MISEMYYGNNFDERCLKILTPLTGDDRTRVTGENCALVNTIISSTFQYLLERKYSDISLDSTAMTEWFMKSLHYMVDR